MTTPVQDVKEEPEVKPKVEKSPKKKQNPLKGKKFVSVSLNKKKPVKKENTEKRGINKNKGVVYVSHLPHGFYENELRGYFEQFGVVTGVKVPRAKSGKARGYAFVEFLHEEVAKVAAETMDNYLMLKRLMKTKFIPGDAQRPFAFRNVRDRKNESVLARQRAVEASQKVLTEEEEKKYYKRSLKKIDMMHKKLKDLGIDFNFQVDMGKNINIVLPPESHPQNGDIGIPKSPAKPSSPSKVASPKATIASKEIKTQRKSLGKVVKKNLNASISPAVKGVKRKSR